MHKALCIQFLVVALEIYEVVYDKLVFLVLCCHSPTTGILRQLIMKMLDDNASSCSSFSTFPAGRGAIIFLPVIGHIHGNWAASLVHDNMTKSGARQQWPPPTYSELYTVLSEGIDCPCFNVVNRPQFHSLWKADSHLITVPVNSLYLNIVVACCPVFVSACSSPFFLLLSFFHICHGLLTSPSRAFHGFGPFFLLLFFFFFFIYVCVCCFTCGF